MILPVAKKNLLINSPKAADLGKKLPRICRGVLYRYNYQNELTG
jgi:hypothetical protein